MKIDNSFYAKSRKEWRVWLKKNHNKEKEVWLIYYKKHTGKSTITYNDAVEEAICFGWIDSIVKRIDPERYCQKFTPRKDKSNWSVLNKKRAKKMINDGQMTDAGMNKLKDIDIDDETETKPVLPEYDKIPDFIKKAFCKKKIVWENFNKLSKSNKKYYLAWIMTAKREETRQQRLSDAVKLLAQNKKLGLK